MKISTIESYVLVNGELYIYILGRIVTAKSTVVRIAQTAGLVGALSANPRITLEEKNFITESRKIEGSSNTRHGITYLFIRVLQLTVLVVTPGLFAGVEGVLISFEEE